MSYSSDPVIDLIRAARIKLLIARPWFGTMATRLVLVEAPWTKTMATDGRHLYWNREFVKACNKPELLFVIAHEVYHGVFDHVGRRGTRDKDLWNMAADYWVNYSLVHEAAPVGKMPPFGLLDDKYTDDMTVDEIYDLLVKNSVTIKPTLDDHLDAAGAEGEDEGDGSGDGDSNRKSKGGGDDEDGDGLPKVTILGKNGPPKLSQEDLEQIRNELRSAMVQTAQQVGAGNVPKGVRRLINQLIEPKLDWRTLIDTHLRSAIQDDYTMQRLSRRSWYSGGFLFPAQDVMEMVEIFCFIDASGSTTPDMVRDFLSEVLGIAQTFRDFRLAVACFDTEVYNFKTFTPDNIQEIYEYEIRGDGGTMFECVFEYMKREGIEPHRLAILTDGLPNAGWGDPDYVETIFVIHTNSHITAPWGVTAHYEPRPLANAA